MTVNAFSERRARGVRRVSSLYGGFWNFDIQDFCYMTNRYFPPQTFLNALGANLATLVGAYPSTNRHLSSLVAGIVSSRHAASSRRVSGCEANAGVLGARGIGW